MATSPGFLAIGHVTKDLLPGAGYAVGGTVTYAALTARNLGLPVAILTSAPPELNLSQVLQGTDLHVVPSRVATTFENVYRDERRVQYVHGVASPLMASHLPTTWKQSSIVLLGPLVGELGLDWLDAFPSALVGVTPQGWMRQWDDSGRVTFRRWTDAEQILSRVDVLVFSEEDVGRDQALIRHYAERTDIAAVTRGCLGATVFWNGTVRDFPAFRASVVDPTGAGDVFAAAFLVRLKETGDPSLAGPFANSAASLSIEGAGTTAIPSRDEVEERMLRGKLYD